MTHECATVERAYAETEFDDWPPSEGPRAHLAQIPLSCDLCGAWISALSDYGFYDFQFCDEPEDEPEFVHCCWKCKRPIYYGERDEEDTD